MYGLVEWEDIRDNKELIEDSIKLNKDGKLNNISVCDCILFNYEEVDKDIYDKLIELVYTIPDIARLSKFSDSFLQLSLINPDLKLTDRQKEFACSEAILLPGASTGVNNPIHGSTKPFDLRYTILANNNWTLDEKKKLVYEFYKDESSFNEAVSRWEDIVLNNELMGVSEDAVRQTQSIIDYIKDLRNDNKKIDY